MSDDTIQLLSAFRSEIPLPTLQVTEAVLERITATSDRRPQMPLIRRRFGVVLALGLLMFAAAAVAAVKEAPWWQSGEPPTDPQQVVSVARDNLPAHVDVAKARTVVTSGDAGLVAVPLNSTGYCLIPALDGRATFGAQCEYQVRNPESGDDDRAISATRRATATDPAAWIVYGRITDPRASRIDLGPLTLSIASGGFFLARVPEADWARLSGSATSGAILDSSGGVLRRGCVNWAVSPGSSDRDGEYPVPLWSDSNGSSCKAQKPPVLPTVELGTAKKLFDVTLTQNYSVWKAGQTVTFEAAERSDGTRCLVATGQPPSAHGVAFSSGCGAASGATTTTRPIHVEIGAGLTHVDGKAVYTWDISGSVAPASKISKLELRSDGATTPVAFGDGFFFAQFPATTPGPQQGTLSMPPGDWRLVGLDSAGNPIAQVDLVELHRQASPH
jgi:hypothetical protein